MIEVLLTLLLIISLLCLGLLSFVLYRLVKVVDITKVSQDNVKLVKENALLKERQKEYRQMFGATLDVLQEDTRWIKSTFFQRFGSVPEYQELNSQIISFENKLDAVKETLRTYRMIETYE